MKYSVAMEFDSAVYVEVEADSEMDAQRLAGEVFVEHFGDYVTDIENGAWFAGDVEEAIEE